MNHWNLIVEVYVADDAGQRIATGYPIAPGLILTAGHVLRGATSADVRWRIGPPESWQWNDGVEVAWDGARDGDGVDAALLRVEFPRDVVDWCPVLDEKTETRKWDSRGFPAVGEREHSRDVVSMHGTVHDWGPDDPTLTLGVDHGVAQEENWRGASGSPVMIDGRVAGIIESCPTEFNAARLTAIPMHLLLARPDFARLIGYDKKFRANLDRRNQKVRREIVSRLKQENLGALRQLLMDELGIEPENLDAKGQAEAIVDCLLKSSFDATCIALTKVHAVLCDDRDWTVATDIGKFFNLLVPLMYPRSAVHAMHSQLTDTAVALVSVAVGSPLGADATLAAIDGRPMHVTWADDKNSAVVPASYLPRGLGDDHIDAPEPGKSPTADDHIRDIVHQLAMHPSINLPEECREFARWMSSGDTSEAIAKAEIRHLARRLEKQLEIVLRIEGRRFFFAFRMPRIDALAARRRAIVDRLVRYLPSLAVIQLSSNEEVHDRDQLIEACLQKQFSAMKERTDDIGS